MKSVRWWCLSVLVLLAPFLVGQVRKEPNPWQVQTVQSYGGDRYTGNRSIGMYTSLAIDAAGHPHISCWEYDPLSAPPYGALKYIYYNGSEWLAETVVREADGGAYTSLALDRSNQPHVAYRSHDGGLRYAYRRAGIWHVEVVSDTEGSGFGPELDLDAKGHPHISYYDGRPSEDVRYAYSDGTTWHDRIVGGEGRWPSLALDSADRPHIGYIGDTSLQYTYFDGTAWQSETVASEATGCVSLALARAGQPHLSYCSRNRDTTTNLVYTYFDGRAWQHQTIDSGKDVGKWASLSLDTAQRPHIAYLDGDKRHLKYAYFDGTSWQVETVDSAGNVGTDISLALDAADQPHISYHDATHSSLKYAFRPKALLPETGISPGVLPVGIIAAILLVAGILSRYAARRADHGSAEQDDHDHLRC